MTEKSVNQRRLLKSAWMLRPGVSALLAAIVLVGVSSCSTSTKQETTVTNSAPGRSPTGATAQQTPAPSSSSKIPASLVNAGEYGENIYDFAKANNWTRAATKLVSLKGAAKQLRADLGNTSPNLDRLDVSVTALDKALAAKDRQATMHEANQETRIVADTTAPFHPTVPIEVTYLDYQGRELEVWAGAKDTAKLKATADDMQRTWETLRPQAESHGGAAEAKKFGDLMARVAAAKTSDDYAHLATPVLDEVDNLEKVFQK